MLEDIVNQLMDGIHFLIGHAYYSLQSCNQIKLLKNKWINYLCISVDIDFYITIKKSINEKIINCSKVVFFGKWINFTWYR